MDCASAEAFGFNSGGMTDLAMGTRGLEENIMALLDASGVKDNQDVHDDKLSFLDAVGAAFILAESAPVPSRKLYGAVFQIFREGLSLELTMASCQLLRQLDEHFPRVYLEQSNELVVHQEAWSPFVLGVKNTYGDEESSRYSSDLIDLKAFFLLVQQIAQTEYEMHSYRLAAKDVRNMLLLRYLVDVLKQDFESRSALCEEVIRWDLVRDSLLHMFLGSRRTDFKNLVKECLSIICKRHDKDRLCRNHHENSDDSSGSAVDHDNAVALSTHWLIKDARITVQEFLSAVMELDVIRETANADGYISRADNLRTFLMDIIIEELTYNKGLLSPFLMEFSEPRWKLRIVLQYFGKYCTQTVCTRGAHNAHDFSTLHSGLKCLLKDMNAKSYSRKMGADVVQRLLAHAFQAYLSLKYTFSPVRSFDGIIRSQSDVQLCKDLISVFQILRTDEHLEIEHFEKEALFMAATFLSKEAHI